MNMRKTFLILSIGLVLAGTSCNEKSDPEVAAEGFLSAYYECKYDEAAQFIAFESLKNWHEAYIYPQEKDTVPREYIIKNVTISEDENIATALYYLIGYSDKKELILIKENDAWKVIYERKDAMGVAKRFLDAFYKGDFETAKQLTTTNARKDLEHMEVLYQQSEAAGSEVDITGVEYDNSGKRAIVFYQLKNNTEQMRINMNKEEGEWRVTFSKLDDFERKEEPKRLRRI